MSDTKYADVKVSGKVKSVENPDDPPIEDLEHLPVNETEVETSENISKEVVQLPRKYPDMREG